MAANPDFYNSRAALPTDYQQDVSFVGSFNPYRRALIADCVRRGVKPVVCGRGWSDESPSPYRFEWDLHKISHDLRYYGLPRLKAEGIKSLTDPLKRKYARQHAFKELIGPDFRPPCLDEVLPQIFRSSKVNLGFSDTGWHSDGHVIPSENLQCRLRDFEVPMSGGFYLVQKAPGHDDYYKIGEEIETWSESEELVAKATYYSKNVKVAERIREAGQRRAFLSHTWQHRFDELFGRLKASGRLV